MTGVKICAILETPTQYGELENITLLFLESSIYTLFQISQRAVESGQCSFSHYITLQSFTEMKYK